MLAGHDECDGTVEDGVMKFYGMASESAMVAMVIIMTIEEQKVSWLKWIIGEKQMIQLKIF